MLRTAYVGILDPVTRTHLTHFQGKDTKPDVLKQEILRFVSNPIVDNNAMQEGSIGNDGQASNPDGVAGLFSEYGDPSDGWDWYEYLNATYPQKGGWYQPHFGGGGGGGGR